MSEATHPLLPDVGVLALVPDPWNSVWQLRHQVLTRLARYFRVVWTNPARSWREVLRRHAVDTLPSADLVPPGGLTVYEPEPWLPKLARPSWLATLTLQARLRRARSLLVRQGCRTILLYVWRPEFVSALNLVRFEQNYYHIDDEYSFSDVDVPLDETEKHLIEAVDQVFISSPALMAKKGAINSNTAFVPNGASYAAYSADSPEPADIASIPRPRIGYTGVIKRHLDWPLLMRLPVVRPDWFFVFVGPIEEHLETQGAVQELARHPNVHFLGFKSQQHLAAYPRRFDVCVMPYRVNDYTKYIYPLKLHEYLASGRPVVSAQIRSVEAFGDVVTLVSRPDGWPVAISEALTPSANAPERRAARQAVARQHDWDLLVSRIAGTIATRLGPAYLKRLEGALEADSTAARSRSAVHGHRADLR